MDPSLTTTNPRYASGQILLDRYRLQERLGAGEFGDVFGANDLLRASVAEAGPVAIKVLSRDVIGASGGTRSVAARLATACRFSHPCVFNVFDFYEVNEGGCILVVMERLAPLTLTDRLESATGAPPFPVEEGLRFLEELVEGLAHVHTFAPLLRLHPGRIHLVEGSPCIADLGLAPLLATPLLRQAALSTGISAYTAPEILFSDQGAPDHRADQFSLGAIAAAVFTGSPKSSLDALSARLAGTVASPWLAHIPRLMAVDPADRFDDLQEFRAVLTEAPDQRRTPRLQRRALRPRRSGARPRRTLAALALVALAAIVVTAVIIESPFVDREGSEPLAGLEGRHEFRRLLQLVDEVRLEFCANALSRPEFSAGARNLADAHPELAAAWELGEASRSGRDNDPASDAELTEIRASLHRRIEQFEIANRAVAACDHLAAQQQIADQLATIVSLPEPGQPKTIASAYSKALRQFEAGQLNDCLLSSRAAGETAASTFRQVMTTSRGETTAAREAWLAALGKHGDFPPVDPIGDPATMIEQGNAAAKQMDLITAISRFRGARILYHDWTAQLAKIPPPPETPEVTLTNSLGMRFVPVRDLAASIWETRLIDFLAFAHDTGHDSSRQWRKFAAEAQQGPLHPASFINLADAEQFCSWLTERDRTAKVIDRSTEYRIPTDLEWSRLAGLDDDPSLAPHERSFQHPSVFPWGNTAVRRASNGNYDTYPRITREHEIRFKDTQDPFPFTSPVGFFAPSPLGLYDLGGNIWEWTTDTLYGSEHDKDRKVIRGAGWRCLGLESMRTAHRGKARFANAEIGFRIVLAPVDESNSLSSRDVGN